MADRVTSPGRKPASPPTVQVRSVLASLSLAWTERVFSASIRRSVYLQIERGLHAGLPVKTHLDRMAGLAKGRRQAVLKEMIDVLDSGGQLYEAAFKAAPLFPPPAPALLCAAERTGKIPTALASMAESLKFDMEVSRRILRSIAYPAVLVVAAAFLIPIPRLFSCGSNAYIVAAAGTLAPFAVVALIFGAVRAVAFNKRVQRFIGVVGDNLPWIGTTRRTRALAITLDTLGQALSAGIGLFESLTIARTSADNGEMTRLCDTAIATVKQGGNLSTSFGLDRTLPDEIAVAITTGEQTGDLPEALADASKQLRERYAARMTTLVRVLSAAVLSAIMIYAAASIIRSFTQILGIGGGGFDDAIQQEMKGVWTP